MQLASTIWIDRSVVAFALVLLVHREPPPVRVAPQVVKHSVVKRPAWKLAPVTFPTLTDPSTYPYPGACSEEYDFRFPHHIGADGVPDSIIRRTFDSNGRPASEDWQRPDAPHRTMTFAYDDATDGRLARETLRLFEGRVVSIRTHRYNDAGHEIEDALDENADGRPDWLTIKTYNANNELVTMRENVKAGTKRRGIGHWYEYDATVGLVRERVDNDGDGKPNLVITYSRDERGRLLEKRSHWFGKDAPLDEVFRYSYDNVGNLIAETDRNGFVWAYSYDGKHNLLAKEQQPPPQVADRTPLIRITYGYDCWRR